LAEIVNRCISVMVFLLAPLDSDTSTTILLNPA
jgi:hypothetical protein